MNSNRKVTGHITQCGIYRVGVDVRCLSRIIAHLPETFLDSGIGHHGNCRVVDLKVPATFIVEIPNLVPVRRGKIGPELVDIAIRLFQRGAVGTPVQHCWRRHCESGNTGRDGFKKTEMVEHARLRSADFSLNHHRGGLLFRTTELRITVRIARVRQLDALKTVKKIDMPPISPELSIGHNLEADSFLQCDRFPDAFVFDSLKSRNLDFPLTGICPRVMEFGRPQEATDMFDVEEKFFRLHSFAP